MGRGIEGALRWQKQKISATRCCQPLSQRKFASSAGPGWGQGFPRRKPFSDRSPAAMATACRQAKGPPGHGSCGGRWCHQVGAIAAASTGRESAQEAQCAARDRSCSPVFVGREVERGGVLRGEARQAGVGRQDRGGGLGRTQRQASPLSLVVRAVRPDPDAEDEQALQVRGQGRVASPRGVELRAIECLRPPDGGAPNSCFDWM